MTLRRSVRSASETLRRRPGLFVLGVAVSLLQVGAITTGALLQALVRAAVAGPRLATQPLDVTLVAYLGPVFTMLLLVPTLPLLVAIYVPARAPAGGFVVTISQGTRAVRRRYRLLFATVVRADAVAVFVAVVGLLCWYVLSTVGRAARYVLWNPSPPYPLETPMLSLGAFLLALATARVVVGFADVAVLSEGVAPETAWRASVGFARSRPRVVAGYAVLVGALSLLPVVPATVLDGATELVVGAVLGGGALTAGAVLHVTVFDRHARLHELTVRSRRSRWPFDDGARVAVAALVLLAGIGGAAAVRLDETAVHEPRFEEPAPDASPSEVYAVALENTQGSNHRMVLRGYNLTDGDDDPIIVWDTRYDFRDRQASIQFYAPASSDPQASSNASATGGGGYYDTGVLGVNVGDEVAGPTWDGTWKPIPAPGWAFVIDRSERRPMGANLPNGEVAWSAVHRNDSTLVLRVTEPAAIRAALAPSSYAGMSENMTDDSHLAIWVDLERVVVDRVVWEVHSRDTGHSFSYEVRTSEVGTYDVTRPESLPPRGALEWVWDAVYY